MKGLVEEIQALALDQTVSVEDLLRRVKLAATKLQLGDTADWVDRELKGYDGVDDNQMPVYRVSNGRLMQQHPMFGRRIVTGDPTSIAVLSMMILREPISNLEALAKGTGEHLSAQLEPEMEKLVRNSVGPSGWTYYVHFNRSTLVGIVSRVRDLALDWAMELEKQGILGEGISFSVAEKEKAQEVIPNITIHSLQGNIVNGGISGNQNHLNVASEDTSQNQIEAESMFQALNQAIQTQVDDAGERAALLEIVKSLEESRGTPNYAAFYQQLLANSANCMTILTPFLPALTSFIHG